eukprot:3946745-Alexandrium_andersonii.AAC.1
MGLQKQEGRPHTQWGLPVQRTGLNLGVPPNGLSYLWPLRVEMNRTGVRGHAKECGPITS